MRRHVGRQFIEEVPADLSALEGENRCIQIKNLVKVFSTPVGPKIAVNDLNVVMYEGQIFCLLGHNGAGKTTTINMLCGMLPVSDGTATVYGLDICEDMPAIRNMMAVCPQFDILWDNLTVKEHLYIAAKLQNVPKEEINDRISSLVYDVGLTEKLNKKSKTLSNTPGKTLNTSKFLNPVGNLIVSMSVMTKVAKASVMTGRLKSSMSACKMIKAPPSHQWASGLKKTVTVK